jgi:YD repeat-containing protein
MNLLGTLLLEPAVRSVTRASESCGPRGARWSIPRIPVLRRWQCSCHRNAGLLKLLIGILGLCLLLVAAVFAGPVSSGAVLLLLPAGPQSAHRDTEASAPVHKGYVNLDTGLYIRENEDLIVEGTPRLVLRRTYQSGYRAPKEFGIGTTHSAELYLIGDGKQFAWAALIRPGTNRVRFERTSSGISFVNAMYEHRETPGDWLGARLGWTGVGWALRRLDGSLFRFRPCGPDPTSVCSIVQHRDADGNFVDYRRDAQGRLSRMEAGSDRWIALEYDDQSRIARAYDSTKHEVRYEYDNRGRLSRVTSAEGIVRGYTYTDRDEMATVLEPETDIENSYEGGRCVRQVNRYSDGSEPFIFEFTYKVEGSAVVQTDTRRSNGSWTQYTFSKSGFTTSESWGRTGAEPAHFTYERDPITNAMLALSLTCPDRTGRPLRHSSLVRPGQEERVKENLLSTHCSWSDWRRRTPAVE